MNLQSLRFIDRCLFPAKNIGEDLELLPEAEMSVDHCLVLFPSIVVLLNARFSGTFPLGELQRYSKLSYRPQQ